jgi:uncharacterized protein
MSLSPADGKTRNLVSHHMQATHEQLIQISGTTPETSWKPSRFNARALSPEGDLILYNSLSGAFSGFRPAKRAEVEGLLKRAGTRAKREGLVKYLVERGFLVPMEAKEFDRFRLAYGAAQHRQDVLELILLASEECNFRCVYCYETFPRSTMEPWVREAVLKLIERRAPRLNKLTISWFGGEPLLGLDAIRTIAPHALDLSQRNNIPFRSDMTTNGYLLTPEVFEELVSWNVKTYQISIDGGAESHDHKRVLKGGGDTYDVIMRNLRATKKVTDFFKIILRVNYDLQNIDRLEAFTEELLADFAGDTRYSVRFYPVGQWGGENDADLQVCGTGKRQTQALQVMAAAKGAKVESPLANLRPNTGLTLCYAARPYNLLIGADGKIMKCTIALDTKDHNVVGRLTGDGRADIDIDKLARWVAPYYEDDAGCKSCFFVPVCQGCSCPLVRIESSERPCPDEKSIIRETLRTAWSIERHTAAKFDLSKSQRQAATLDSIEN